MDYSPSVKDKEEITPINKKGPRAERPGFIFKLDSVLGMVVQKFQDWGICSSVWSEQIMVDLVGKGIPKGMLKNS